jgi:hypothetical protein
MEVPRPHDRSVQPSVRAARELLGVAADADSAQLARAYRSLARRLHPDVSVEPDATERFSALQAAYHLALDAAPPHDPTAPVDSAATVAPAPAEQREEIVVLDPTKISAAPTSTHPPRLHVPWLVAGPVRVQPPRRRPGTASNSPEQHR